MRVDVDESVAYLLAVLAEQKIEVPPILLLDLGRGVLGSIETANALVRITGEFFAKRPPEESDFLDYHDTLIEATRDAMDELLAWWQSRVDDEEHKRDTDEQGRRHAAKLRKRAEQPKPKRGKRSQRRAA